MTSGRQIGLTVTLILSLLFAQWLGLAHAIGHADVAVEQSQSAEPQTVTVDGGFDHQKSATACASLEGATLSAALHSPAFMAALLATAPETPVSMAEVSWLAPFHAHFSSRAPPLTA